MNKIRMIAAIAVIAPVVGAGAAFVPASAQRPETPSVTTTDPLDIAAYVEFRKEQMSAQRAGRA